MNAEEKTYLRSSCQMFGVDDYIALVASNLVEKDDLLLAYLRKVRELEISPNVKNLLFTLLPTLQDSNSLLFSLRMITTQMR